MILFEVWNVILIYVKYKEWYMEVSTTETHTEIVPVPNSLPSHGFLSSPSTLKKHSIGHI